MSFNSRLYSSVVASLVAAATVSGCGVFEGKKKSKSSDPAPVAIDTTVTPAEAAGPNGGISIGLKFGSNVADAKFKCLIEQIAPAPVASTTWTDCQERLDLPKGMRVKLAAKAVDAAGNEDKDPAVLELPSLAAMGAINGGQQGGDQGGASVATEILGKAEIGSEIQTELLKLSLGIKGGNAADYRFECKRETEAQFRLCSRDGSASYDFGKLVNGQDISLVVRAVHNQTGAIAAEDSIAFKVALSIVEGGSELQAKKDGEVAVRIRLEEGESATCEIRKDNRQDRPFDCKDGVTIPLDRMAAGSYALVVTKRRGSAVTATESIAFCARQCGGTGAGGQEAVMKPQKFLIGTLYEFVVPEGMHVTEYSTTKTYNRQLSFYRVLSDFDPHYIGNTLCNGYSDRKISALTPRGQSLDYCHSTVQDDVYKYMTDYRLANNHIEVATDADIVESNPSAHERIMINVFDADYEFQRERTRFEYLCMNRPLIKSPLVKMFNDFWQGDQVRAEFWMCDTDLPGTGPGFPGVEQWRVGAFIVVDSTSDLPNMYCSTCTYNIKKAVEVVYMARPNDTNWRPENFARSAQIMFLKTLRETQP